MQSLDTPVQDVMQICRNGHVITDLLRNCPERGLAHCDICGAATLDHCSTCGHEIAGAIAVPGLQPVGARPAPHYCDSCGAAFPWTDRPHVVVRDSVATLEHLLRRVPRVIRQLRDRRDDRPPFRVQDEKDLEDLLRALLPLHFDDVRPQNRTPRYSPVTRMDFLLAPEQIAVTAKIARTDAREPRLAERLREDVVFYSAQGGCRTLVALIYDPEGVLREPTTIVARAQVEGGPELRVVVGEG